MHTECLNRMCAGCVHDAAQVVVQRARAEQAEAELAECRTFTVEKVAEVEFLGRKLIEAEAELERLRAGIREAMQSRNELAMFNALKALVPDA